MELREALILARRQNTELPTGNIYREAVDIVCAAAEGNAPAIEEARLTASLAKAVHTQAETMSALGDQIVQLSKG